VQALHFGAGNIGRGFIGLLLHEAGYHTTFIDVNDAVIQALNEKQAYKVILAAEESKALTVKNVSGINNMSSPEKVVEAMKTADLITTAVGPNILPIISELIAKGLQARNQETDRPLNIIACENMIGGSSLLKEKVFEHLSEKEKETFDGLYGFPDAAVDRIVPNQENEDILEVSVEPYYEWVVEDQHIKGEKPNVAGIHYVHDLKPYIERKLFTVNTGHASCAYIGHYLNYATIKEAMDDQKIQKIIKRALTESGEALIQTYNFEREAHQQYIDTIIERFLNPYISDEVTRVGRGPLRKLGPNDRLIRPASLYLDLTGKAPTYLAKVIAAALQYENSEDEESVELQEIVQAQGYEKTLQKVGGLDKDHPLIPIVLEQLEELSALK